MVEATPSAITKLISFCKTFESVFVAVGAVAFVCGAIWWLVSQIAGLSALKEKVSRVCKDVGTLLKDTGVIRSDVKVLISEVVRGLGTDAGLFSGTSPLRLLPKGAELLKKSGFKKIYQENKETFISNAKRLDFKSKAEVDEASMGLIVSSLTNEQAEQFKTKAFENGVSLALLFRVCSIYLRDEIIKELKIS